MAASNIAVSGTSEKLQTWENLIGADDVHTEAVTLVNSSGVEIVPGTALADGAVFTPDTTKLTPIGGYRDDTTPATVTEGDAAACRITENRALHVNLRDAAGVELSVGGGTQYDEDTASADAQKLTMAGVTRADSAASQVSTDGDRTTLIVDANGRLHVNGMISSVIPGTGATNLGKAVDGVAGATDTGVAALIVRDDSLAALTPIDGDYTNFRCDANGALWVHLTSSSVTCTNAGTFAVQESGAALTALQLLDNANVDHDAAVVVGVQQVGLNARTTDGTAVASGDATRAQSDTLGKQVVLVGAVNDLQLNGKATYTTTTAADLIAAQGAGQRIAVMSVLVVNGHATVATKVEVRDGTTVKIQGHAAAAGGGFSMNGGGTPLFISTANTAVTGRNVTTGADVDIFVSGYKLAN